MVKIISRKSLGIQPVYDIGVEKDHNFLLENGLVASNCFNKSHSTAYAYVTYQTAYLKANYSVEYMTALLTASSDSQDKIEKYRENCQRMNINVVPPDINESNKDFTPVTEERKILFGLSAVRNLGDNAIETILKARKEGGKFESLGDFCSRVDLKVMNKRAMETLIYSGAFDKINSNRNQLIKDLEVIIPWVQKRNKEKESGQLSIFGMLGDSYAQNSPSEFDKPPSASPVPDFSLEEKLKYEKENLGFYVSEHPLKAIQRSAKLLSPINIADLEQQKQRTKVSVVVIVTAVKKHTSKAGKQMAFLGIEDISGQTEAVVFSDAYERIQPLLEVDAHLILWGKVDEKDDKKQILVDDAERIEEAKIVMINLTPQDVLDTTRQYNLKSILQERSGEKNKGKIPVIGIIGSGAKRQMIRLGEKYWIQDNESTVIALKNAGFDAYNQRLMNG